MANAPLSGTSQQLRRHTGVAGVPATPLLSGQLFVNDVDGCVYVGIGDNGSGQSTAQLVIGCVLTSYLHKKAINAAFAAGTLAGGVDAMLQFCAANNTAGSNAMQAATTNIAVLPGKDYETLVLLPWLEGLTTGTPPGLGYSPSAALQIATQLRANALAQGY